MLLFWLTVAKPWAVGGLRSKCQDSCSSPTPTALISVISAIIRQVSVFTPRHCLEPPVRKKSRWLSWGCRNRHPFCRIRNGHPGSLSPTFLSVFIVAGTFPFGPPNTSAGCPNMLIQCSNAPCLVSCFPEVMLYLSRRTPRANVLSTFHSLSLP